MFSTIIYSCLIKSGKTLPVNYVLAGIVFTTINGYLQGHYHALYATFDNNFLSQWIRITGISLFALT